MQNLEHQQTNICKMGCVSKYKFLIIGTELCGSYSGKEIVSHTAMSYRVLL
jgi:hypothetical protein